MKLKKYFVFLTVIAAIALAGCSGKNNQKNNETTSTEAVTESTKSEKKNHDNDVTIDTAGTFVFDYDISEGRIVVDAGDDDAVKIILAGTTITNSAEEAINIKNAGSVEIELKSGTVNTIISGTADMMDTERDSSEVSGTAIKSKTDLVISGEGTLNVYAYINDGIKSKANLTINGGTFSILSYGDAIVAEENLVINGGDFTITTGSGSDVASMGVGGHKGFSGKPDQGFPGGGRGDRGPGGFGGWDQRNPDSDLSDENGVSQKGIKAGNDLTINGGNFAIDSYDDSIHANGSINISSGDFSISSGDDGIHADGEVAVSDGTIKIISCYEGIEGNIVRIDGGNLRIEYTCDDGINASGSTVTPLIEINGGEVYINADGDGVDSNGDIVVNGGDVIVHGPDSGANGAIDTGTENGGTCVINGGTFLAYGSSQMAEGFGSASGQASLMATISGYISAGDEVIISDDNGVIYSYTAEKGGNSIVFSSEELEDGEQITITYSGKSETFTVGQANNNPGPGGMGTRPGRR